VASADPCTITFEEKDKAHVVNYFSKDLLHIESLKVPCFVHNKIVGVDPPI
jgi:hypothetical protein